MIRLSTCRLGRLASIASVLATSALCLAACGGDPATDSDPAEPIEVAAAEEFEIDLSANSSTGYEWSVASIRPPLVRFVSSSYEGDPGAEERDGEGGTQTLVFEALRPGRATIQLIYTFTGGEDRDPVQRRKFIVEVSEDAEPY